jgi:hypothetical protein
MKKIALWTFTGLLVASTAGCANGPLRCLLHGGRCDPCNPSANPPAGYEYDNNCQYGDYDDGAYYDGSSFGGATLSPPPGEIYGTSPYGATIVPPSTSEPLPGPSK